MCARDQKQTYGWDLSFPMEFIYWNGKILSLRGGDAVRKQLNALKQSGISWVMPGGLQCIEPADFALDEGARWIKSLLDEFEMRISSHHCVLHTWTSLDESQEKVREIMNRTVTVCAIIQPKTLVIHSGFVDKNWHTFEGRTQAFYEEEKKHGLDRIMGTVADNLKYMAGLAAEHSMSLALENLGYYEPLSNEDTLVRLVDMIDEPNAGFCIDSGHAHVFGQSVSEWIHKAGDKLFETHFHDNRAKLAGYQDNGFIESTKETDEHLPPGFGTINWIDVIEALDDVRFKGPVCFEAPPWPLEDGTESYRHALCWWRTCEEIARQKRK